LSAAGVCVFEVGPRDGLQNEKRLIPTADKVTLIDRLADCGLRKIEAASFVSPKWVPQMADAAEVMAGIHRRAGISYTALTPNLQGFARAKDAHVDEVAVFASASEGFSQKNINCSIAESLERYAAVAEAAQAATIPVRGYVSCVTDCPYDGPTPPASVARVVHALLDLGCYEVSLGDTIGRGTPQTVGAMLEAVLGVAPARQLAGHFHDTGGLALANIEISLAQGLRTFDASVGGLGGCPFAPGAKGNVATEAVVALLHKRGFATGVDLGMLEDVGRFAGTLRSAA
jgi:hydroxymethylglutaryl-CoA lyase